MMTTAPAAAGGGAAAAAEQSDRSQWGSVHFVPTDTVCN